MVNTPIPMMLPITSPVAEVRPIPRSVFPGAGTGSGEPLGDSGTGLESVTSAMTILLDGAECGYGTLVSFFSSCSVP
jgi:hypothetical protein